MEVEETGGFHVSSANEINMTENMTLTETLEKIKSLGLGTRKRKKSKYLSHPYINSKPRQTGLPAETEDSKTLHISNEADGSDISNRYRVSLYNEEAELATSLVNVEAQNSGNPVRNISLDRKTSMGRRYEKPANAVTHKGKSLSSLSDINFNNTASDFLLKDFLQKLKQKGRMEEVTLSLQTQYIGMKNLNGRGVGIPSQGKRGHKRKTKGVGTLENPSTQSTSALPVGDGKSINCSSLVIDLKLVSPHGNGDIPQKLDGRNKEELGFMGSNPALSASIPFGKTGKRGRKRKIKPTTQTHDLNVASLESNSLKKEFQDANGQVEYKCYRRRNKMELKSENLKSSRVGVGPNGFTCLFLKFAPGVSVPSREDLAATFNRFGPLKESEMQLLEDAGIAQIVFVNGADAGDAFRSMVENKPFGTTLIDCKLHLPASHSPGKLLAVPASPSGSKPLPSGAPSMDFIRQNLQMMTLMLENSGDDISPQMRAKLEDEIRNLMSKVEEICGERGSPGSNSGQ
ncbi:hypothetical protein L6164_031671 [Bauhinia variegata]|uniref:Uncharacterized protein n=1 Tax=Bauhinia variegata TaxID=167791 RepID=A0ACB9LG69_BAUVA|nr:hypothetical protein L6164_031671 [Bauhinia variegata]